MPVQGVTLTLAPIPQIACTLAHPPSKGLDVLCCTLLMTDAACACAQLRSRRSDAARGGALS